MTVRAVVRRGKRILVIDIRFRDKSGGKARYRHDAEVQTRAAATAEDRRRLAALAVTGSPYEVAGPVAVEQVAAQAVAVSSAPTFAVTAADYLAAYAKSALKPSTRSGYAKIVNGFLAPRIGDVPIDRIDASTVRELDAVMVESGAKPGTRRQMMIVIRSILCRYAVEAKLLAEAPKLPKLPKQGAKMPDTLTTSEVDRILVASCARHRIAFLLASHAGLRAGEVRGLRCGDVDLRAGHLIVRESICRGETAAPKSGHEREVPLTPRLRDAIEARVKAGAAGDAVALTERGTTWGEYGLRQAFGRACKRAGITKLWRFHDLRHFFVTRLFAGGTGAHVVQALAGHEHLSTTQRYAHVGRADLRGAIALLGA
jgi:integrase